MSTDTTDPPKKDPIKEDEDDDPYNTRIEKTGCFQENEDLQLCFYDTKDWRQCKKEMQAFRNCFIKTKSNAGSQELIDSAKHQD
jgi:cytochrome c oxidase assembly factor 4